MCVTCCTHTATDHLREEWAAAVCGGRTRRAGRPAGHGTILPLTWEFHVHLLAMA